MNPPNSQLRIDTPEALSALANEALVTLRVPQYSKTAFFEAVSDNFEIRTGRSYVSTSCKRTVEKWASKRRAYLNQHQTGRAVGTNTAELDELVDEYIMTLEDIEDKRKRVKLTVEAQRRDAQQDQDQRNVLTTGLGTARGASVSSTSESSGPANTRSESSIRSAQRRAEERDEKLVNAISNISDVLIARQADSNVTQLSMRMRRVEEDLQKLKELVNEIPNQVLDRLEARFRTRGN